MVSCQLLLWGAISTVLNPVLDKFGGREKTHVRARMSICNLINQLNLTDIWRDQHGNIRNYTWKSSSKPPILCRLDYFLISKPLSTQINESHISYGFRSDHSPGFWKFNTSLLEDNDYVETIKGVIDKTKCHCKDNNPNTVWEIIKLNVRGSTIQYASRKKKSTDKYIKSLTNDINVLD